MLTHALKDDLLTSRRGRSARMCTDMGMDVCIDMHADMLYNMCTELCADFE